MTITDSGKNRIIAGNSGFEICALDNRIADYLAKVDCGNRQTAFSAYQGEVGHPAASVFSTGSYVQEAGNLISVPLQ
jgi:hypothetical protein